MKKLYISICLMLVSVVVFSQWFPLNSGTGAYLTEICFTDANTAYVVGGETYSTSPSTIIKTTNGGANWFPQNSNTIGGLSSVCFPTVNIGYAVGYNYTINEGVIIKTTNGGTNWSIIPPIGWYYHYASVCFIDKDTGYVVGGSDHEACILKTTDGGNNWGIKVFSGALNWLSSVYFVNYNVGYTVGAGHFLKTTNAGVDWQIFINQPAQFSVYFIDTNIGFTVGSSGDIYKTTNGGLTWISQISGVGNHLRSVYFRDINTGYTCGEYGVILKTTNGGTNWSLINWNMSAILESVFFTNDYTGYVVGRYGTILKTTNSGVGFSANNINLEYILELYPNPSTNKITITNSGDLQKETIVSIFNIQGKQVLSNTFNNQNTMEIDVSVLAKGVYVVRIQSEKGFALKKLVIQ